jgi:predicted dehydrogenase
MPPVRVAVIGTGSFGRNHLRVYRELERAHPALVQLVALVEPDDARRREYGAEYNIPALSSVDSLLGLPIQIDAASVCVPTLRHTGVAEQLLRAKIDVLIEKPFAATLEEADRILTLARERDRIVAVGHLERFNPAVTATRNALNKPMFFEAHRLSIFTPRSLDVDVVLDLMIHDLDIVLSLSNSPVREVRAVGIPILSRKVDIANVRLEFESGCVANFTASRISTEQVRKLRLFQPRQYLSLDFARQELLSIDVDPRLVAGLAAVAENPQLAAAFISQASAAASSAEASGHPTTGFSLTKADIARGEPLRLELEDFLQAVQQRTTPRVSGEAGRAALALALEINAQIAAHSQRAGLA